MILLDKIKAKKILYRDKSKSYVYGICKENGDLFYVGVGIRDRVFKHSWEARQPDASNRLKVNIIKKEKILKYVIFLVSSNREDCLKMEYNLIKYFGRIDLGTGKLSNLTDGGEFGPSGLKFSEERLKKQTEIVRKNAQKVSMTLKDRYENLSEEEKSIICSRLDQNRNNKIACEKIAKATKLRWSDPDYKNRLSEKQKESQAKIADLHSKNMKSKWSDSVFREKMIEARRLAKEKRLADSLGTADNNVVNNQIKE